LEKVSKMPDKEQYSVRGASVAGTSSLPALKITRVDDPAVVAQAARDDYSLHVVPRTWRLSAPKMALAWSAVMAAMFWVVVAAGASLVVGTVQTLIGLAAAVVVHGAICYYMSRTAAETGLTVGLFSRSMFGYYGASLATLFFAVTGTWFAVFEGSVLAVAAQTQFGGPIALWYLIVTLCAIPLVLGGVRVWLEKINAFLLPIFAIGLVAAVVWSTAVFGYDGGWLTSTPSEPTAIGGPGWLFVFAIYMGVFSNMFYTFDFARMGRTEDIRVNGVHTFGFTFYFFTILVNGAVGIYLVHTIPLDSGGVTEAGLVVGIVKLMGIFGLIFIVATQTKINTANFYLASTNFQSFFSRAFNVTLPRFVWVLFVGVVSFTVMVLDVFSFIGTWLSYQGAVLVAWVGIALVHIGYHRLSHSRNAFEFRPGRVRNASSGGITAWVASSGVGIYLIASKNGLASTWALVITFILAVVIYAAFLVAGRGGQTVLDRPFDPHTEVDDLWNDRIQCAVCDKSYVAIEMDRDPGNGHRPICASCATGRSFRAATLAEASEGEP
jgi:purine-cytosine permease-like protein